MSVDVRREREADAPRVARMLRAVFGRPTEATLVEQLRRRPDALSVVGVDGAEVVAHAIFHDVDVDGAPKETRSFAVGLLAVHPRHRSMGVASRLVTYGLEQCLDAGVSLMFVLGPAGLYRRFGFVPAEPRGLRCRWEVPEGSLLVLELESGALSGVRGVVTYPPEFDGA